MAIDRSSDSFLLGIAEAEIRQYHEILSDLVRCIGDDLSKLPEGYSGRRAIDRAKAKLATLAEPTFDNIHANLGRTQMNECDHPWATTDIDVNSGRPYCQQCGLDWQLVFKADATHSAGGSGES